MREVSSARSSSTASISVRLRSKTWGTVSKFSRGPMTEPPAHCLVLVKQACLRRQERAAFGAGRRAFMTETRPDTATADGNGGRAGNGNPGNKGVESAQVFWARQPVVAILRTHRKMLLHPIAVLHIMLNDQ